jgi:antirestriction protein ArdC
MGNAYEQITQSIIESLEAGHVIWQKPWVSFRPCNAITNKPYRGINPFILGAKTQYTDHRWLTFKQALELKGSVRRGEKGTHVTFSSRISKQNDLGEVVGNYFLLKTYTVFNVQQCDNLEIKSLEEFGNKNQELDPNLEAEKIWSNYPLCPQVVTGTEAFYRPSTDVVTMPARDRFINNAHYYATLFHEGAHATGHESRLNRKTVMSNNGFGSESYSIEELVAEFASVFLMSESGLDIPVRENSVAYLQGWVQALNNDKTMLVKAAAQAQKAADYIMGVGFESEPEPEKVMANV